MKDVNFSDAVYMPIVDLSHDIVSQDLAAGAFDPYRAYRCFPCTVVGSGQALASKYATDQTILASIGDRVRFLDTRACSANVVSSL